MTRQDLKGWHREGASVLRKSSFLRGKNKLRVCLLSLGFVIASMVQVRRLHDVTSDGGISVLLDSSVSSGKRTVVAATSRR